MTEGDAKSEVSIHARAVRPARRKIDLADEIFVVFQSTREL